jgi:hypothetical protein
LQIILKIIYKNEQYNSARPTTVSLPLYTREPKQEHGDADLKDETIPQQLSTQLHQSS